MMCVWQCSPSSTMIQRRPILWATAPVVPEPAKESRTRSPGLVAICNDSLEQVVPASELSKTVDVRQELARSLLGFIVVPDLGMQPNSRWRNDPCLDFVKKLLYSRQHCRRPAPNQMLPVGNRLAPCAPSCIRQHRPFGGSISRPDGSLIV